MMKSIETERLASASIGNSRTGVWDDDDALADLARTNSVAHLLVHKRPEKITRPSRKSLVGFQAAINRCIMVLVDETSAHVHVIGNHSTRGIKLIDAV